MSRAILYRGPDQGGVWVDEAAGIGLSSRRLAIIGLGAAGDQPMHSAPGRYVLSYNGEIYNHREIRGELREARKAPEWRGSSDTETLLAGFEAWGVAPTIERAVGMFAFALWDRLERRLYLGRDRLGEKPLYYGWQAEGGQAAFLFASELKALTCHPAFEGEIDREVLGDYMRYGYVRAPHSIYRKIFKLQPGSILALGETGEPRIDAYWSADQVIENGLSERHVLTEQEALEALEALLSRSVEGQLLAEVPVGAFLSGGVDSSMVVALMQRGSSVPVQTFTAGSEDQRFDEAPFARKVAEYLGTDHHEITISGKDMLAVVPRLPSIYDEPFADSSQVPAFAISQLARTRVTVSLTGDGGDELFAGYDKYYRTDRLWRHIRNVPLPLRSAAGALLDSVPAELWNRVGKLARIETRQSTHSDHMRKAARLLGARSPTEIGRGLSLRWRGETVVVGAEKRPELDSAIALAPAEALMALHLQEYLPDDLLVKVDRAAMACSLETRTPFLDHRVVEFAWRLPLNLKMRGHSGKWILRRLLARHIPEKLFERPKRGFSVPVDEWLRGPLRDWAEEMLSPTHLREEGFFRPDVIQDSWQAHLSGRSNRQAQLWTVLMFEAWLRLRKECPEEPVTRSAA